MKSLDELKKLREATRAQMNVRKDDHADRTRVVVGMATCGIAAGARPVIKAFEDAVSGMGLKDVVVSQTGCIGVCRLEPIVEVFVPGQEKVTYVNMTADKAVQVVTEHLVNNRVLTEYTIGAAK